MSTRATWIATASFTDRRARLRAAWHYLIRRHSYEICMKCGRPVSPRPCAWWRADDELWNSVTGNPHTVRCPPCFTAEAEAAGIWIRWEAVRDVSGVLSDKPGESQ